MPWKSRVPGIGWIVDDLSSLLHILYHEYHELVGSSTNDVFGPIPQHYVTSLEYQSL